MKDPEVDFVARRLFERVWTGSIAGAVWKDAAPDVQEHYRGMAICALASSQDFREGVSLSA